MKRYVLFTVLLGCLGGAILWPHPALAQSVYGGIRGTVRDASGEPVSDAIVTVTSVEKKTQLEGKTNPQGHYEFPRMLPETYDLNVMSADKKVVIRDISVVADDEALVDPILPKGGQITAVTGPAGGSTLKTRSDVSITLDREAIQNLPNFDRNLSRYGLLAPGAQLRFVVQNSSRNPQNGLLIATNGQAPSGTALQLDGTDNRDPSSGGALINATLESVAELRITTQSFDAESGHSLSGIISIETRSGSNNWHGSAFDFRRSDFAEAHNPDLNNPSLAVLAPFKINLFGGSLGGPIVKNKLFIFGDYQGTRRSFSSTQVENVPTLQVRQTCFAATPTAPCDLSEYLPASTGSIPKIYDPLNGQPFQATNCAEGAGFCIPSNRISQQAVSLLSLLPTPNLPGVISNYSVAGAEAYNDDAYNIRVDENLTAKAKLFGRYSFTDYRIDSPSVFGAAVGGSGFSPDGFAGTSRSRVHSISGGFDYALRPNLLTDVRFGFFRLNINILGNSSGTTPALDAGLLGLNLGDTLTSGLPEISIAQPTLGVTGSTILFGDGGDANRCNCPLAGTAQHFQWVNNWAMSHGNHLFKWGGDFRYEQNESMNSAFPRPGLLKFALKDTANPAPPPGTNGGGLGLATLLLGDVSSFSRTVSGVSDAGVNQKRVFLYGQDTWRVTPKFTLSYGLRWEIYFPQAVNGKNNGGWLNLTNGTIGVAGSACCDLQGNVGNSLRNFAPRVGMAYQFNNLTILHVAYGRNFDAASPQIFGGTPTLNPPVLLDQVPSLVPNTNYVFQFGPVGSNNVPPPPAVLFPNIPASGQIPLPAGVSVFALPTHLRLPTLDQWNFSLQRELASNLYMEIAFVGNKGTHLVPGSTATTYNLNQATITGFAKFGCGSAKNAQTPNCLARFPYYNRPGWPASPQPITQAINYAGDDASSNYNSLQAKVVKRFSHGYEFDANYTWAKGQSYNPDYFVQAPRLNYGVNLFDRAHTFIFYNVLALPVGRNRALLGNVGKTANYFVGGWAVNTITTWASGLPFSPTYNTPECLHDRDTGPCRPNLVGTVHITGDRNNYFTTNNQPFTNAGGSTGPWQRPAVGTFGNAAFNSLRGPSFYNTDLAVTKDVAVSERVSVQFRTDFLNVFNKVNLANPSGCVDCIANGMSAGAVITNLAPNASQRQIQFALRVDF
jgi:hypothetical protein